MPTKRSEKEIELLTDLTLAMRTGDPNKKYMAYKALNKIGIDRYRAICMLLEGATQLLVSNEISKRRETP